MYGTLNPRKTSTVAITDSRGYLLAKKSKFSDSFNHGSHVYDTSAARWPKVGCICTSCSCSVLIAHRNTPGCQSQHIPTYISSQCQIPRMLFASQSNWEHTHLGMNNMLAVPAAKSSHQHRSTCYNGLQGHSYHLPELLNSFHSQRGHCWLQGAQLPLALQLA